MGVAMDILIRENFFCEILCKPDSRKCSSSKILHYTIPAKIKPWHHFHKMRKFNTTKIHTLMIHTCVCEMIRDVVLSLFCLSLSLSLPLSTHSYTVEVRRRTYSPKLQCGGWTRLTHMLPMPLYPLKWTLTLLSVGVDRYTTLLPCLMLGGRLIYLGYLHSASPWPRTRPINTDWGYPRLASPCPRTTPINIDSGLCPT